MSRPKLIEISMVEDNPGDVRLTREALRDAKAIEDFWLEIVKLPPNGAR